MAFPPPGPPCSVFGGQIKYFSLSIGRGLYRDYFPQLIYVRRPIHNISVRVLGIIISVDDLFAPSSYLLLASYPVNSVIRLYPNFVLPLFLLHSLSPYPWSLQCFKTQRPDLSEISYHEGRRSSLATLDANIPLPN